MSQPIELSDELLYEAREVAQISERSVAGQIELWVQLGRAIEPLLDAAQALALRQAGAAVPLSRLLSSVDTPEGRQRVADYLESTPFPHYKAAPDAPGLFIRTQRDGTQTRGRFVDREFRAM
jgi:hypothetical protein